MPWIIVRASSDHVARRRRGDPAHHLGVAALVDPVLGPGAGVVLGARDLDERDRARRRVADDPVGVGVTGEVPDDVLAPGDHVEERLVVGERESVVRVVVVARDGARTRARDRGSRGRGRRASPRCAASSAPPTRPGTTVSSTASTTPSSAHRVRRVADARARGRASRRGCRARGASGRPSRP